MLRSFGANKTLNPNYFFGKPAGQLAGGALAFMLLSAEHAHHLSTQKFGKRKCFLSSQSVSVAQSSSLKLASIEFRDRLFRSKQRDPLEELPIVNGDPKFYFIRIFITSPYLTVFKIYGSFRI